MLKVVGRGERGGGMEGICLGTAVAAGKIRDMEYGSDSVGRHRM